MEKINIGGDMLCLNILIIILILEFLLSLIMFKNDILSPAVLLSVTFLISAFDLKLMESYWRVELVEEAILAIAFGNLAFICTSFIVHIFSRKKKEYTAEILAIHIDKKLITFIDFIYILVLGIYMILVFLAARHQGATGSIFTMVGFLSSLSELEGRYVPGVIMSIYNLCVNLTYLWVYIAVINYKKIKMTLSWIILLIISFFMGLLVGGSRGELVSLIVFAVVLYLLIYRKQQSRRIPLKYYLRIIIGLVIILVLFQFIATFMGRDSYRYGFIEYLSIYIGAPIMNFSNAVKESMDSSVYFGQETFHRLMNLIGPLFGIKNYKTTRLFWTANGHNVGNVATMYYDYYHDWGMAGAIIMPVIMALILQFLYEKVKKQRKNGISIFTMTYAWMFFLLLRSFFSNTFIDTVFSISFIKQLIVWYLTSRYFIKLRLK